jgi:hypothetical protein
MKKVMLSRLNDLTKRAVTGMRKSDLRSKDAEVNPKRFARHASGHKSNRMVLNAITQRLAVSMRQTEDQLIRNLLQASAGFVNCVNGVNG